MTVKSADKKPEKYVGPDGKPKIRMVSVDKEVVKNEAYNEPQGQAKRMASPLQKARMDKEKRDRDLDGNLKKLKNMRKTDKSWGKSDAFDYHEKSEGKTFKDFREANTPVGQRDKMKIIDRKPHPDGGHIVTMQTKAGKTIKRHLKNGKVKDMTEAKDPARTVSQLAVRDTNRRFDRAKKSAEKDDENSKYRTSKSGNVFVGLKKEAIDMSKVGTKATIMHPVTRVAKKVDKKDVKKHVDAGWMHMGPKRNRVTKGPFKTKEGYASDAQRKAVWASKNEKDKKESVDEVLDTPKAMQSYKDKAKASYDKATSSAAAKILRGKDKDGNRADHRPELKTMDKRKKGMAAADMVAVKRTFDALRGKK